MADAPSPTEIAIKRAWWMVVGRSSLALERLFGPAGELILLALAFLAVVGAGLLTALPIWLHGLALALFAAAAVALVWRAVRRWRPVGADSAARRLEQAADLRHRPLDVARDRPVNPEHAALWARWSEQSDAALDALRAPAPRLSPRQPMLWPRALVAIAAVIGLAAGWGDIGPRFERALTPLARITPPPPPVLDAWITPPDYTGEPVIRLADGVIGPQRANAVAPAGSILTVVIGGVEDAPEIGFDQPENGLESDQPTPGSWRFQVALAAHDRFVWRHDDKERADFAIAVRPDDPPQIEFAAPPQRSAATSALRLRYAAEDDYALTAVRALIALAPDPDNPQPALDADPLTLDFAAPAQRAGIEVEGEAFFDLAAHPWAGLQVLIRLEAEDAAGQIGQSDVLPTALPQRVFNHPLARLLVEQRQRLAQDPALRPDVARVLEEAKTPPVRYDDDPVVYLGLEVAARRLVNDASGARVPEVQDLLWALALRLEDGGLSLAAEMLRDLQRELMNALQNNNALSSEIEQLGEEMRQAMQELLQQLAERMANAPRIPADQIPPDAQMLDGRDLMEMLDQALELSRTGNREAAAEMLAQLQRMLENLQMAQPGDPSDPGLQQGQQALDELNSIIQEQSDLADRTFRDADPGQQDGSLTPGPAASEAEQEALRQRLENAMRQFQEGMGEAPAELGRAERQMGRAGDALGRGAPGQAIGPQGEALDELRAGAEAMAQSLAERFGGGQMAGPGEQGRDGQQGQSRDPFGRRQNGDGTGGVDPGRALVPDEAEVNRARALIEEMRRRLQLPDSPELEQLYLRRLLERF